MQVVLGHDLLLCSSNYEQMLFPWDGPAVGLFSRTNEPHDLCLVLEFYPQIFFYQWKYVYQVDIGYKFFCKGSKYWEGWSL